MSRRKNPAHDHAQGRYRRHRRLIWQTLAFCRRIGQSDLPRYRDLLVGLLMAVRQGVKPVDPRLMIDYCLLFKHHYPAGSFKEELLKGSLSEMLLRTDDMLVEWAGVKFTVPVTRP